MKVVRKSKEKTINDKDYLKKKSIPKQQLIKFY